MSKRIRYAKREYRGYGNLVTRYVPRSEMLRYLKEKYPTDTPEQLKSKLKKYKIKR